jgi:hypothetical protein
MPQRIRRHLSFANVASLSALVFAMGGTSYALSIPKNSVGTAQIKKSAVANSDLRANAVTSGKVKNGALEAADFKLGQIPAGAKGATGATGPAGAAGPTGPKGAAGPAGQAVAYARVAAAGTIQTNIGATPSQAKNIAQASITHPATGVYCFSGLSFTPATAVVALDNADANLTSNQIASVAVFRGEALGGCAAGAQARVNVVTPAPAGVDHGFTVWFE